MRTCLAVSDDGTMVATNTRGKGDVGAGTVLVWGGDGKVRRRLTLPADKTGGGRMVRFSILAASLVLALWAPGRAAIRSDRHTSRSVPRGEYRFGGTYRKGPCLQGPFP